MMDYTIEEWAEKIIRIRFNQLPMTLSECTLIENNLTCTISRQNRKLFAFNKIEYLHLKEQFQSHLKKEWRFFYYFNEDEHGQEKIFIFERIENKDRIDYTFQLTENPTQFVLHTILAKEELGSIYDFLKSYGAQDLIDCKKMLFRWFTEAPENRISYLLHPENYRMFRSLDEVLKNQKLLELSK